jgi:hypothetical protein
MNLPALTKNKVLVPVTDLTKEFVTQLELVDRDITQAQLLQLDYSWRFIIAYNALAGLARLVIMLQGYKSTGLYGNSVSIDLMVHFANTKLSLPKKEYLTNIRKRRNELTYRQNTEVREEELEFIIDLVLRLYDEIMEKSWRGASLF